MARLKISTFATSFIARSDMADALAGLAAAGIDGVELPAPPPDRDPAEIIRQVSAAGLAITSVGTIANIPKRDLISRERTPESLRPTFAPTLRLARLSGAGRFTWGCGERPESDETMDQFRARLVERLAAVGNLAAEEGLTFAFEPWAPDSAVIATSTPEGVELIQAAGSPGLGMCYDTYHASAAGEDPVESLRLARPWLAHVHVSDFRKTERGFERPLPGRGSIDYGRFLAALAEIGYAGYVGIEGRFETADPYAEVAACVEYLRRVGGS